VKNLFSVGYGHFNRENYIYDIAKSDPSIALILAAVTFEWTFKRFIMKLGKSKTDDLRKILEKTYSLKSLKEVWHKEIGSQYKKASIKDVLLDFFNVIEPSKNPKKPNACDVRGEVIHGNGSISSDRANKATREYLFAARFLYLYAETIHRRNLDKRLISRK